MVKGSGLAMWHAVLAAASTVAAGTTLSDTFSPKVAGTFALLIASAQTGTAAYYTALKNERKESDKT